MSHRPAELPNSWRIALGSVNTKSAVSIPGASVALCPIARDDTTQRHGLEGFQISQSVLQGRAVPLSRHSTRVHFKFLKRALLLAYFVLAVLAPATLMLTC